MSWHRKHFDDLKGRVTAAEDLRLADFIFHGAARDDTTSPDGDLWIVRTPVGAPAPVAVTYDKVKFKGFADPNLHANFMAKQIAVANDPEGNLTFRNIDAASNTWIVGLGTNLLLDPTYGGDTAPQVIRSAVNITSAPWALTNRVFENRGAGDQDIHGVNGFNLRNFPSYRLHERSVTSTPQTKQYWNPAGALVTVNGDALQTLVETPGLIGTMVGLHNVRVSSLLDLSYFGGQLVGGHHNYAGVEMILTPEGLVIKFTERVRADVLPAMTSTDRRTALTPSDLNYTYNASSGFFELKHVIRFRGLGFGWGQHGRINSGFFTPRAGRFLNVDYVDELSGRDGADFSKPITSRTETRVQLLRRVAQYGGKITLGGLTFITEELDAVVGGRFFTLGKPVPVDALVAFDLLHTTAIGPHNWFALNSGHMTGADVPSTFGATPRGVTPHMTHLTLGVEMHDAMCQAVNQLKEGAVLDLRSLRVWHGRILDFNALPSWTTFGNTPMPKDCAVRLDTLGADLPYWLDWFADNSVAVANGNTATDLPPSLQTYQTRYNQQRSYSWNTRVQCSGGAFARAEAIYENPQSGVERWWYAYINGTITTTLTPPTLNAPTTWPFNSALFEGFAVVDYPGFNFTPANLGEIVRLKTAYNGLQWLTHTALRALSESYELNYTALEVFIPLVLDSLEAPPKIAPSNVLPQVLSRSVSGEAFSIETSNAAISPPPTAATGAVNAAINTFNAIDRTVAQTGAAFVSTLIAFRLASTESEIEWKIPVATSTPPTIYSLSGNRGRLKYRFQIYNHPGVQIGANSLGAGASLLAYPFSTNAPYVTTDALQCYPNPALPPYQGRNGSQAAPWYFDYTTFTFAYMSAGPQFAYEFDRILTTEEERKAENLFKYVGREQSWIACQIVSSDLALTKDFYLAPQHQWGQEADWWLQDEHTYLQSALGRGAQSIGAGEPWVPGNAPRRNISAGAGTIFTAGTGITILTPPPDRAAKVIYDTRRPTVAL